MDYYCCFYTGCHFVVTPVENWKICKINVNVYNFQNQSVDWTNKLYTNNKCMQTTIVAKLLGLVHISDNKNNNKISLN